MKQKRKNRQQKNKYFLYFTYSLLTLFVALFISVSFLQQSQRSESEAQIPSNVPSNVLSGVPSNILSGIPSNGPSIACSQIRYYCLINGGGKCGTPPACPTPSVPDASLSSSSGKIIVHFDFDKYDIRSADMPALNKLAAILKKNSSLPVTINGYTDSVGTPQYNMLLSQERARSVKNYLTDNGAKQNPYSLAGYGIANPVAPNTNSNGTDNPAGRALNRRAEIMTGQQPSGMLPSGMISGSPSTAAPGSMTANGSGGYVAPSTNTCGGKYNFSVYPNKSSLGKNFGDPNCDFTKDKLLTLLKQKDPSRATQWFNKVIPCESGYDPNAWAGPPVLNTPDPHGGWGLLALLSSNPPGQPANVLSWNGLPQRGDLNWPIQVQNAVNLANKLSNPKSYWSCW